MGDIEIFVHDYCEAKISRLLLPLKTDYKHVRLFLKLCKNGKIAIISDDYHDIGQLLLLSIITILDNYCSF